MGVEVESERCRTGPAWGLKIPPSALPLNRSLPVIARADAWGAA
jgi:hypothetical protein